MEGVIKKRKGMKMSQGNNQEKVILLPHPLLLKNYSYYVPCSKPPADSCEHYDMAHWSAPL